MMGARAAMAGVVMVGIMLAIPSLAHAQRGVPQAGFPSWQERMLLVYVNRARADPPADLASCTVCAEKACYPTPLVPVAYSFGLNRAARFHGANLEHASRFSHDSPCELVANLSTVYAPTGACVGEVACACVGGALTGATAFGTRIGRFLSNTGGSENIAYGNATPRNTFYQWFWESEPSAACGFRSTNGHRYNILRSTSRLLGNGYYRISRHMWVQDFMGGSAPTGTLLAGGHEPQFTGAAVEFRTNYYDTGGAPQAAVVNVAGTCSTMTLERGSTTNATYLASQTLAGTTCRRYRFEFRGPGGTTVYLPETGSYGAGGAASGCEDWNATTPPPCGTPPNQAPTVATAASATPSPVTGTSTQLAVLGADDAGEPALSYTWAATGPAAVTIAPNGTGAAKAATATFARAGTYTFTATLRDAGNLTATSAVTVIVQPTPTTLAVAPSTASVPVSTTQQFTATVHDQFAVALASQPTKTWTVGGGGTISASGLFTAGTTTGGPYPVTATAGGKMGTAQVTVTGPNAPTIAQAATATPSPVTGTTTTVSVLGASGAGEAALTYTWTSAGPAPITVAPDGTNAAKTATITFTQAGSYTLTAQIADAQNQTATSSVAVTVVATPSSVEVVPATAVVVVDSTRAFVAMVADQFGTPASATSTWSVDGGGSVDAQGEFTAGAITGGPFTLTATAGGATGTAQIVVAETEDTTPPTVEILSPADGAVIDGATTLAATATDDLGVARVVFTIAGQALEATAVPWEVPWDATAFLDGQYAIEAQAFDLAGNPSAPAAITVEVRHAPGGELDGDDEASGCGCGTSRGAPGADGVLVLLAILVLGRRRRSPAPRSR